MEDDRALEKTIREVLRAHPVQLGLLFGSQATGEAHEHSDIDIAVEFDSSVTNAHQAQLSLGVSLARALKTDDVDVIDLTNVRPSIGYAAVKKGRLLVGTPTRVDELIAEFERERDRPTGEERRERFDNALERLEELV